MNEYFTLLEFFVLPFFHLLIMSKYMKTFLEKKQHKIWDNVIWLIYYYK